MSASRSSDVAASGGAAPRSFRHHISVQPGSGACKSNRRGAKAGHDRIGPRTRHNGAMVTQLPASPTYIRDIGHGDRLAAGPVTLETGFKIMHREVTQHRRELALRLDIVCSENDYGKKNVGETSSSTDVKVKEEERERGRGPSKEQILTAWRTLRREYDRLKRECLAKALDNAKNRPCKGLQTLEHLRNGRDPDHPDRPCPYHPAQVERLLQRLPTPEEKMRANFEKSGVEIDFVLYSGGADNDDAEPQAAGGAQRRRSLTSRNSPTTRLYKQKMLPAETGDLINILLVLLGVRSPCCMPDLVSGIPYCNWMEICSTSQEFVLDVLDIAAKPDPRTGVFSSQAIEEKIDAKHLCFGEREKKELLESSRLWRNAVWDAYRQRWPSLFWQELLEKRVALLETDDHGGKTKKCHPLRAVITRQLDDDGGDQRVYVCVETNAADVRKQITLPDGVESQSHPYFADGGEGDHTSSSERPGHGGHRDSIRSGRLLGYHFPLPIKTLDEDAIPGVSLSFGPNVQWIQDRYPVRECWSAYKLWTMHVPDEVLSNCDEVGGCDEEQNTKKKKTNHPSKQNKKKEDEDQNRAGLRELEEFMFESSRVVNILVEAQEIEADCKPIWQLWADWGTSYQG